MMLNSIENSILFYADIYYGAHISNATNQARIVDMLYERIHQTTQAEAYFVPNYFATTLPEVQQPS